MAKRYPKEFRDDVVKVARLHQAPMTQIAKDFGISDATLYEWMKKANIEDGARSRARSKKRRSLHPVA
jgi:transposase